MSPHIESHGLREMKLLRFTSKHGGAPVIESAGGEWVRHAEVVEAIGALERKHAEAVALLRLVHDSLRDGRMVKLATLADFLATAPPPPAAVQQGEDPRACMYCAHWRMAGAEAVPSQTTPGMHSIMALGRCAMRRREDPPTQAADACFAFRARKV